MFDAIRAHNVGVFGIKPFASNSVFKGDSTPNSPTAKDDDEIARLTLRYILGNDAITAPIPGLISTHQVENAALAVSERRKLDMADRAQLEQVAREMTDRLPEDYAWLRDWEWV
jgi:predicted aldo/keto reductase-like oxidoreductase